MEGPFYFGTGGVVSADIAVPGRDNELAFYASVLTTGSEPFWREDLSNRHSTPIIGLGERTPEYESLPLQWMPHIQVADVAACAAKALELGGQELLHGKDDQGNSQWACLTDPHGAAFGVIPIVDDAAASAYQHDGVPYIAWLSLHTPDIDATAAFYVEVIGWSTTPADDTGRRLLCRESGEAVGEIGPSKGDPADSAAWLIDLPVADLDESLRRAARHGGRVVSRQDNPSRAIVRDPVGVHIGLQSHR